MLQLKGLDSQARQDYSTYLGFVKGIVYRSLQKEELDQIWSIDKSEYVDFNYRYEKGELIPVAVQQSFGSWTENEIATYSEMIAKCFESGGETMGAFCDEKLVGVSVLDAQWLTDREKTVQLKFLYVDRSKRGEGIGKHLFSLAAQKAQSWGTKHMYISSSESKHTVDFYLGCGCQLTTPNAKLFEKEPEDLHLEFGV